MSLVLVGIAAVAPMASADTGSVGTTTVTTFSPSTNGCAGGDILPIKDGAYVPLPFSPYSNCTPQAAKLGIQSATAQQSADSTGSVTLSDSAANGNQLVGEQAQSWAGVSGESGNDQPASSIDIVAQFTAGQLAATDYTPPPVDNPFGPPNVPADSGYVGVWLEGYGPGCADGSSSASTNSIYISPGFQPGAYTFKTKIYCPDGSTVSPGGSGVSLDMFGWVSSNNGSTQKASGSARLISASFTVNP